METLFQNQEQEAKKPEIIHSGDYDIIFASGKKIDIKELVEFLDTIDDSLVIDERVIDTDDESDLDSETGKKFVFQSGENRYFIKQKWYDVPQQERKWGHRDIPNDASYGSILNEFIITPMVQKTLETDDVQNKIKEMGYERIDLIPVVAGVVRRSTGQKFLIYDFFEMIKFHDPNVEEYISETLIKRGIDPKDIEYNLTCDKENPKILYLLDIEGYRKT